MSEESAPAPETVPGTAAERRRRPQRNDFSWAGLILGLGAAVLSVVTNLQHFAGFAPGFTALLFSAIGVGVAARRDVGMARSLFGGFLGLFALIVTVYSMGTTAI